MAFARNRRIMASMAANVNAASPAQQSELVQMLVERVVASGGRSRKREITWTPPARPFFAESGAERWWECPPRGLRGPARCPTMTKPWRGGWHEAHDRALDRRGAARGRAPRAESAPAGWV